MRISSLTTAMSRHGGPTDLTRVLCFGRPQKTHITIKRGGQCPKVRCFKFSESREICEITKETCNKISKVKGDVLDYVLEHPR